MDKLLLQETANELDKQFPKGTNLRRGKALVLFGVASIEAEKLYQQGISDTLKKVEDTVFKSIEKVKKRQRKDILNSDLLKGKMFNTSQVADAFDGYADWLKELIKKELGASS